ncbi:uncharacterized protein HMPREF1541_10628 [Cyphellophora europaea CBS 101466]|uniref:Uncharacterized protein n=1 Tax=Cyphellophora europaea (strain CBS 101466) TaxID=1220924 RepID=W2S700_CYPE1|nr:uncharacterized protein HMPREF1541_10628 [Cyphellophora europaea CBS 101466]ETN44447.1 hypothetical protein HMPREF1541_10628 [Cyphellophora europaea CBS 101466]
MLFEPPFNHSGQYLFGTFQDDYDGTIEDSYKAPTRVESEVVWLELLDTGGDASLEHLRTQWCRAGAAFIIVFSCASRDSFNSVRLFGQEIAKHHRPGYPLALVATKTDLRHEVSCQEGQEMAKKLGAEYFQVSGKNTEEAKGPFAYIARHFVGLSTGTTDASKPTSEGSDRLDLTTRRWTWSAMQRGMIALVESAIGPCIGWSRR